MEIIRYKKKSGIENWGSWPKDVEPILQELNKKGDLTFQRVNGLGLWRVPGSDETIVKCEGCLEWFEPAANGVAVYKEKSYCDYCMIVIGRLTGGNRSVE